MTETITQLADTVENDKLEAIENITSFYGDSIRPEQVQRARDCELVDITSDKAAELMAKATGTTKIIPAELRSRMPTSWISMDTPRSKLEHDVIFVNYDPRLYPKSSTEHILQHELIHCLAADNRGDTGYASFSQYWFEQGENRKGSRFNDTVTEVLNLAQEHGLDRWRDLQIVTKTMAGQPYFKEINIFVALMLKIQEEGNEISIRELANSYFDTSEPAREKALDITLEMAQRANSKELKDNIQRVVTILGAL